MCHGLLNQIGSNLRVGAIAIDYLQIAIGLEVGNLVAARGLHALGNRDAVSVIFDIEQLRQIVGRGNV